MEGKASSSDLPPGFRFHPTDEELIVYYLRNQAMARPCPVSIIPEVNIYKFDPWQLPEKALFGENEWYFFSPRDRKYPNGVRPNRAAVSGYWKATGTDKAIHSGSDYVGVKKALVFYKGRPPKGVKTDWIMHEYRLNNPRKLPNPHKGTMRLDDWVLCRIYKKRNMAKDLLEQKVEEFQPAQMDDLVTFGNDAIEQHISNFPRICSISHLLDMEYLSPQLLYDNNSYDATFDFHHTVGKAGIDDVENPKLGEIPYQYPCMDSGKTQVNQDSSFCQPIVVKYPVYDMHGFDC